MEKIKNTQTILFRMVVLSILGLSIFLLAAVPDLPQNKSETTFKSCAENYPVKEGWGAAFFDLTDGGTCWSCPNGYERPATVYPVSSDKACVDYKAATKVGKYGCKNKYGSSAFFDAIQGGTCWTCPSGYIRT